MRLLFKPALLALAALNLFFFALMLGTDGNSSLVASELFSLNRSYTLSDLMLTRRVASLVEHQYVDPTRVHPEEMFESALEQVQRGIPEVMFEYSEGDGNVTIWMGDVTNTVPVGTIASVQDVVGGLQSVFGVVQDNWTGDPEGLPDVEYDAINGMLSTLDPHSILLPPVNAKRMDIQIQGQFGGLGITISLRGADNSLTVISVLDETPAMRAGLKAGDRIVQIDGESTVNISLDDALSKLRGTVGSKVTILIDRKTFDEPRPFKIRRDLIKINSVETTDLGDGIGLIKIKTFQHNTYQQMLLGLNQLKKEGPIKGLILDLRNNPGGPLQQAVEIVDRFIDEGPIVSTVQSNSRSKEVKKAHRSGTEEPYPMAVIMDSSSASASEIVGGGLKNANRAVVIGDTSFGKGSVQNLFPNMDDSKLKLTMLQYLTPGDESIQSVGITPDVRLVPVYFDEELVYIYSTAHVFRERDLEAHLDVHFPDQKDQEPPKATVRYFAPDEFAIPPKEEAKEEGEESAKAKEESEEEETIVEPVKRDPLDDFQVRYAKELLAKAGRGTRKGTLSQATAMLQTLSREQSTVIQERMTELGLDWTAGTNTDPKAELSVRFANQQDKPVLYAGDDVAIVVTVKNNGEQPIYQGRAITHSEMGIFDEVEFLFGKVEPGQSRSWTREMKLPKGVMNLAEMVQTDLLQGDSDAAIAQHSVLVQARTKAKSSLVYSLVSIDDGSGKSVGNGDGRIQVGEEIDLLAVIKNVGDGVAEKPYLRIRNQAGRDVFLDKGTATFEELQPGDVIAQRLHFKVLDGFEDSEIVLGVRVGERAMHLPEKQLALPVAPSVVVAVDKTPAWKQSTTELTIMSAAEGGIAIATLPGGSDLLMDGVLGDFARVQVRLGEEAVHGWVAKDSLKKTKGTEAVAVSPLFEYWYPSISVEVPAYDLPSTLSALSVSGVLKDDDGIKNMYAFVNGKKRHYMAVPTDQQERSKSGVSVPFKIELPLEDGPNFVEIHVHDLEELQSVEYFQVYRETIASSPTDLH